MKLTADILKEIVEKLNHDYIDIGYRLTVKDLLDIIRDAQDLDE